ncbi:MAG: NAD-dependent epimerase/dehydratase family protein [Bacteroidota bacterium]
MNILLTGAQGLLGQMLLKPLSEMGLVVAAARRSYQPPGVSKGKRSYVEANFDLRDYASIYRVFKEYNITHVVHSAAISHPGPSLDSPLTAVQINFDATVTLLEAARLFGVKRFIYMSSIGVYGRYRTNRVTEEHPMEGNSPYGVTKVASELMGNCYDRTFDLPFVSLRYGQIYGPLRKTPCPIKMVVEAAITHKPLHLSGGADACLHAIYQEDTIEPVQKLLLDETIRAEAFNIVDGYRHTLREVVTEIKKIVPDADISLGPGPLPQSVTGLPPEIGEDVLLDASKAMEKLEFKPQWTLPKALVHYVETLQKNYDVNKEI